MLPEQQICTNPPSADKVQGNFKTDSTELVLKFPTKAKQLAFVSVPPRYQLVFVFALPNLCVIRYMIKKEGSKWVVLSEKTGRKFGTYKTKKEAIKRLQQVEFFKHAK